MGENENLENNGGYGVGDGFGNININTGDNAGSIGGANFVNKELPTKTGFWTKIKAFLFQDISWTAPITVELTPYQQKVEDEINEFLHQDVTWKKVKGFLFKEIKF